MCPGAREASWTAAVLLPLLPRRRSAADSFDPTPAPDGCLGGSDVNLGPITDKWVQVYTSDTLIILVNPHTYRLRR